MTFLLPGVASLSTSCRENAFYRACVFAKPIFDDLAIEDDNMSILHCRVYFIALDVKLLARQ